MDIIHGLYCQMRIPSAWSCHVECLHTCNVQFCWSISLRTVRAWRVCGDHFVVTHATLWQEMSIQDCRLKNVAAVYI